MSARRTARIAAVVGLLGLADAALHLWGDDTIAELPSIPAVDPSQAAKLALSSGDSRIVLERRGPDSWAMTAPQDGGADRAAIQAILQSLRTGVSMDAQVDDDNLEDYGLKNPEAVLVELFDEGGAELAAFYVGRDAAGGSSFIRFRDDDNAYRARIGGRHRYERAPAQWRDPMVLSFEADWVAGITLDVPDQPPLAFERNQTGVDPQGKSVWDAWTLPADPLFPVDQRDLDGLAKSLGALRSGEILSADHPAGLDRPAVTVTVDLATSESPVVEMGSTTSGAFARRVGEPAIYRIAPSLVARLSAPRDAWFDRSMLAFDPLTVDQLILEEASLTTVLQRNPADSSWTVIKPRNVAADLRAAMFTARHLGNFRVDAMATVTPEEAGFPTETRAIATTVDGGRHVLEIGALVPDQPRGQEAVFVRTPSRPQRIGVINAAEISSIRKAWAR